MPPCCPTDVEQGTNVVTVATVAVTVVGERATGEANADPANKAAVERNEKSIVSEGCYVKTEKEM